MIKAQKNIQSALPGYCFKFADRIFDAVRAFDFDQAVSSLCGIGCQQKYQYITPLRKYDLHRESSGIPDVLAVEETLDHIGLPLATVQV